MKVRALVAHASISDRHQCCVTVNLGLTKRVFVAVVLLAGVHVLLDYAKARFSSDTWVAFTIDQAGHLLIVGLVSLWLVTGSTNDLMNQLKEIAQSVQLYLFLSAYVAVIFGGGFLVQKITQFFLNRISADIELKPGLPNAGKYIGWLERFLILTFVVGGYGEAVGFLLAAKALARYPEIKEDTKGHFAEYFLLGTLTSVGLALAAGLAVVKLRSLLG